MERREFLGRITRAALALGVSATGALRGGAEETTPMPKSALKKALILGMLPGNLSVEDRFKLAGDLGFRGIEVEPISDPAQVRALRDASEKTGVAIHSVIFGGWGAPLSSPDPKVVEKGVADLKAGLGSARELGADTLLLVPAVVNEGTRYRDAYERSQEQIRKLIPLAEKLKVVIAVEDVWNNFLLSPLEFARYIDELDSPFVKAYFDVGNVVAFGWPEDWIRTLGKRIHRIHLKDFRRRDRSWQNLGDGDVNWPQVRKALAEVGYKGYLTAELPGGDGKYLRNVSGRIERLLGGG